MNSEHICARIKAQRKRLGYSYADLARLCGISKSSLQRYETGVTTAIPLNKLPELARALQISATALIGTQDQTDPESLLSQIFVSLSPANQQALLSLAQNYLASERKSTKTP